jgi:alcohol dehydrogenase (cytochrome c)
MAMGRRRTRLVAGAAVLVVAIIVGFSAITASQLRWRAEFVRMKAQGELPALSWRDVASNLGPRQQYHISTLLRTGDVRLARRNLHTSPRDVERGAMLFRERCAACHGVDGSGGTAPGLNRGLRRADTEYDLFRVLADGIPGTTMDGVDLPAASIWRIAAYVRAIDLGDRAAEFRFDPSAGVLPPELAIRSPAVTAERLLRPEAEPHNWLAYGGSYASHRHSPLDSIDRDNVRELRVAWVFQMPTDVPTVQATPLVVDGIMYVSEPPAGVVALDAATGERKWHYTRRLPDRLRACCGLVNRGVAVLGDRLFMGTLDARLISLDARTGAVLWDVEVADYRTGHSITSAPLALSDKIIIGIAGGEYGIRGFLDAYDPETGERLWRFYTIPGPGEPGHETWSGDSWRTGGAPTWMVGSYDPELNLIYWGVGNPGPPWQGDDRPGDNLYSNSVIALDADTGELVWFFQSTPHDVYDWDATQVPVLIDAEYQGRQRRLMAWANRNAFYYLLDRETGEFLLASQFARQSWAGGIDATGRPIRIPGTSPSPEGTLVYPAGLGATNWWPPAFNPATGLLYVPTVPESSSVYYSSEVEYTPGQMFLGSGMGRVDEPIEVAIKAIDPLTGEIRWRRMLPEPIGGRVYRIGGALSIAGGLVFSGSRGTFVGLDADTGEKLWEFATGGTIMAAPVSYAVDGSQYVAVAAGRSIFAFTPGRTAAETN